MNAHHLGIQFDKTLRTAQEGIVRGWHPGFQLFVAKNDESLLDLGIGNSSLGRPMDRGSVGFWFSSGKPVTAVAVAQLVEEGRLGWDDPVARWIPEFATCGKAAVTVRDILTHTGGFRAADAVPESTSWSETLSQICRSPLESNAAPGETAGYHTHSSWSILAEVIQRVSGEPFEDRIRKSVFGTAGMDDSYVRLSPAEFLGLETRVSKMHMTDRGRADPDLFWNTPECAATLRPGAFLRGPIRDLGRLYQALLRDPSPLLRRETIELMTRRHRERKFDDTFKHVVDFGLGFIINSRRYGVETVPYGFGRHAGEKAFGHGGQQTSCAFADPENGLVVAWVFNGLPGVRIHHKRGMELNNAIYEDLGILRKD